MKFESTNQFLARGGKILKLAPKLKSKKRYGESKINSPTIKLDVDALPEALKIRYGIKF